MSEATAAGGFEIAPKQCQHPVLNFLHGYWDNKRGARLMPARADIKPTELKDHLGWISMLDVLPQARDFRYRLIGTLVTEYFFWDPTGKTLTEAFATQPARLRDAVLATFRCVVDNRAPLLAYGDAGWAGKGLEECEALYLPLSDDDKTVNVILHAFVFDQKKVLLARTIARANGGRLVEQPGA
ncbi:MAG TPA: PAS domain-containing protein [Rhizomicrobium sp.]|nr:PAS domain-containing protein [Rhizomicrobium sp.]